MDPKKVHSEETLNPELTLTVLPDCPLVRDKEEGYPKGFSRQMKHLFKKVTPFLKTMEEGIFVRTEKAPRDKLTKSRCAD